MIVADLIKRLEQMPQDAPVRVFDPVLRDVVEVRLDSKTLSEENNWDQDFDVHRIVVYLRLSGLS